MVTHKCIVLLSAFVHFSSLFCSPLLATAVTSDPKRMARAMARTTMGKIPATMKLSDLNEASLISLAFGKNDGKERLVKEFDVIKGSEAIAANKGKVGSLCFVVRRPG